MDVFQEMKSYLEKAGTSKSDGYSYKGYFITLDRMGGMTTFVNVRRDVYDEDVVASATIEDGRVELKKDSGGMTPTMNKMRYRGPESVLDALLSMNESKNKSRKNTMKLSERKLKRIIREETKKAMNERSKDAMEIGSFAASDGDYSVEVVTNQLGKSNVRISSYRGETVLYLSPRTAKRLSDLLREASMSS
jgi:hypothetical protein